MLGITAAALSIVFLVSFVMLCATVSQMEKELYKAFTYVKMAEETGPESYQGMLAMEPQSGDEVAGNEGLHDK